MTEPTQRRPLPALVFLIALTLLTALVWWRVLHRSSDSAQASSTCPSSSTTRQLPRPSTVSLSVLNSTTRAGIAKAVAAILKKDGFTVNGFGNDTGHAPIPGVAEIRYSADQEAAATLLRYYLPDATLVPDKAASSSHVVISLGTKYKAVTAPAAVSAALTKDNLTLAPSSTPASSPGGC